METPRDAILLRVFIGNTDRVAGRALYLSIVEAAFKSGIAGATALSGLLSYGHGRRVNYVFNIDVPGHLPTVVEIIDVEDKIQAFLPQLDKLIGSGLVTLEKVRMARVGRWTRGSSPDLRGGGQ